MPVNNARVNTRDLVNSVRYPFLIATAPTKYPNAFNSQKKGIANTFTIKGPIKGTVAIRAANPAKAWVKTPITTVPKRTTFSSMPSFKAMTIASIIAIHINMGFLYVLKMECLVIFKYNLVRESVYIYSYPDYTTISISFHPDLTDTIRVRCILHETVSLG